MSQLEFQFQSSSQPHFLQPQKAGNSNHANRKLIRQGEFMMKAKRTTARRLCLGTCLPSQPQPSLPCPSTLPQPILLLDLSPGPDVHIEVSPQKNPSACFPSRVQAALISCRELNKASLASHSPGWNSLALAYPLSFESLEATRWSRWGGRDLASNPSSAMTSQETLGKYSNSTASFPHPHTGSNAVHPTRCEDQVDQVDHGNQAQAVPAVAATPGSTHH